MEALDERVARVDLKVHLRRLLGLVGLHGAHDAAHGGREELVGVERDDRAVDEAFAGLDLADLGLAELVLEPGAEGLHVGLGEGFAGGGGRVAEVEVGAVGGDEALALEGAEVAHHELVDRLVDEEDLEVAGLEGLEVRAGLERGAVEGVEEIDLLLRLGHALHVFGQRGRLALLGERGLVAQELRELFAVREVGGDAFLQEDAELLVEVGVAVGVLLGLLLEELQVALRDDAVELLDERGVLHGLAGDVQREIGGIDDALEEAQPLGEQALGLGVDEDVFAVERDARLHAAEAEALLVLLRREEQGVDGERGVGVEVEAEARLVEGLGLELVELGVLLVLDCRLRAQPERLDLVDLLAVEVDRERDERGVVLEDAFHLGGLGELLLVVLEGDDDLATALLVGGGLDLVVAGAVAGPDEVLVGGAPGVGVDLDLLGRHEGRVEADAELADEAGVGVVALLLEGVQEGLGAGMGNGAEVLDQLGAAHADAVVLEGDGASLVVGGDVDLEREIGVEDVLLDELEVAELLEGVARVGDQLADEDLAVGVERVDDEIEELLNFGLEDVFFGGSGHERKDGFV